MSAQIKTEKSAEARIRELAAQHGIDAEMTNLDYVAKKFTELADSDMEYNELRQLAVNLARANILTSSQAIKLYGEHVMST